MLKNVFISAFAAVFFYVAARFFHYRLMNKRFFNVEFKLWVSKGMHRFQFILIKNDKKTCQTSYGTKHDFNFLNLYKDLMRNLDKFSKKANQNDEKEK